MKPGTIPDNEIPAAEPAAVIQQYKGWVMQIVKRYSGLLNSTGAIDTEDMVQAGIVALLEAMRSYDPTQGKTFIGWSFFPIRNEILKLFGYDNPGRKQPPQQLIYLDEPFDDEGTETLADTIEDPNSVDPEEKAIQDAEREEIQTTVRTAIERIQNENYRKVVKSLWLDGKGKKELAEDMGISVKDVSYLDRTGRSKLSQDWRLKRLAYPLFRSGLSTYKTTLTSAVERAILWREQQIDIVLGDGAYISMTGRQDPEDV